MSVNAGKIVDENGNVFYPSPYFPVGCIYISVTNVNPSTYFGGTWESFGSGKTLVGVNTSDSDFNSVKKTGGSKTHTHTQGATGANSGSTGGPSNNTSGSTAITVDQMPSHRHAVNSNWAKDIGNSGWGATISTYTSGYVFSPNSIPIENTGGGKGHTHTLSSHTHSLNSHTHTNPTTASSSSLQPYITVYFWLRTA